MPGKVGFRVIHVSGQDENFKAIELNSHSPVTKGWQSSRYCLYPQDIVVQLEKRSRLRKIQILSHQYLIATKIEFYVGDVPEGIPATLQHARYTRLGYVSLSNNEKTGYKARELKSVHVDAHGRFVKFVIHKNHVNKHNLYNQVGVVAVNVIGDDVNAQDAMNYPVIGDDRLIEDPSLGGLAGRPDYISPLDDLAFDMYQDPEVAQIIRRLENKKHEAVLQERYDYAKKLKNAIQDLQKVGEKLGKYEVEKRQAVENEDYDKAKSKKVQMDEYRLQVYKQLELHDLLELTGSRHPDPVDLEPIRRTPQRLTELNTPPPPRGLSPSRTPYDDRPLPAIKNQRERFSPVRIPSRSSSIQPHSAGDNPPKSAEKPQEAAPLVEEVAPPPESQDEDKQLPSHGAANPVTSPRDDADADIDDSTGNVTGQPEPMSEKDMREAGLCIDVFGLPLVSKAYSKTWSFREDALLAIYKKMSELPADGNKDDTKAMMRAAVFLIAKSIKDKVFAGKPSSPDETAELYCKTRIDSEDAYVEYIPDNKGFGVFSKATFEKGDFLLQYADEKITEEAAVQSQKRQPRTRCSFRKGASIGSAVHTLGKRQPVQAKQVFKAALNLLKMILTEFVPNHRLAKAETINAVEKTLPPLLHKTGDTAVRQRETAKQFIYEEAKFPEVKSTHTVPAECVKPFKLSIAPRLALSRTEVVDHLYKDLGLENSGLTLENIMIFCTQALQHTAGEVREKAEKIIVSLYKDAGAPVKHYLPPDDDKTRRNVLYKQLFEAFDKIDGKPSKEDIKKQKAAEENAKQKEIEELQNQLQALKDMAAGKAPADESVAGDKPPSVRAPSRVGDSNANVHPNVLPKDDKNKKGKLKGANRPPPSETHDDDLSTVYNIDNTCIFCSERNESFTEEGLDLHYWKSCPMLKRCANCKQVVEIAGFTEHLLTECEAKDNYSKDPRCSEAIPKADYEQHIKENSCNPAEPGKNHCPLCHENIPLGEEEWKTHLMGKDGCKQNPRRLQALNKQPAPGKSQQPAGRGKSKIPAKTTGAKPGQKSTPRK